MSRATTLENKLRLIPYEPRMEAVWDEIIRLNPDSLFFFERGYLAHQTGRYQEESLLIFQNEQPVAVLPLVRNVDTWISYAGLPFGGLQGGNLDDFNDAVFFENLRAMMKARAIKRLIWTPVPWYYTAEVRPSNNNPFAAVGHTVFDEKISCIRSSKEHAALISRTIHKRIRRVRKLGDIKMEAVTLEALHDLVSSTLFRRHGVQPLHSVQEWKELKALYPDCIHSLGLHDPAGRLMAGVLVYQFPRVLRMQAMGYRQDKESAGWVAALYHYINMDPRFSNLRMDMGTSMDPQTGRLNQELHRFKKSLGGHPVPILTYKLEI